MAAKRKTKQSKSPSMWVGILIGFFLAIAVVIEESYDPYSDTTVVRTTRTYSCPGCQGALTTFFHKGKLGHQRHGEPC